MKIVELKMGSRNVNVTGKITEKEETREVNTKFGRTMVSNAVLEDDSGFITLVLWGEEADKIKQGDTVKIENGFVNEWNGVVQLSTGKFGKMTVV